MAIYRYVTEGSFDAYMWQALETKARFIAQVMTGECGVRRAEDIGGQELTYAEVKAIASGNPAVLTLAEADAELQRLAILRKNHADEQYLARRNLRDLPETIARQAKRVADLTADLATLAAHASDPLTIGERRLPPRGRRGRPRRPPRLPCRRRSARLDAFPLGVYRGLRVRHGAAPAVGPGRLPRRGRRRGTPRSPATPRAPGRAERPGTARDRHRSPMRPPPGTSWPSPQGQLRDYQARLGRPFAHDAYRAELADLRDRLKRALSAATTEPGAEAVATPQDLAERIRGLKESHSLDSTPQAPRLSTTNPTAERPVTARIRERRDAVLP